MDKNNTCVFLHIFMPTVVIPLNDVFVAYLLGYMQVYPICLEQAQAMREHRAERREMAEKSREAMAQQREQMAGRMKAVLTPEQYAQWIECRECPARKVDCAGPACRKGDANPGHHRRPCN